MHDWEAISKTRASCFIGVSKHSKTIKALGLRPHAFISFLVFGNPDETLALVFEILHHGQNLDRHEFSSGTIVVPITQGSYLYRSQWMQELLSEDAPTPKQNQGRAHEKLLSLENVFW